MRQGLRLEPLLQAISDFLDDQKDMIDQVRCDLIRDLKNAETGRSGMTPQQILRSLVLMRIKNWNYRELRERIADGCTLRQFTDFYCLPVPQHDAFHRGFTRLTPETLKAINDLVVQAAVGLGLEDGQKLRVDTTVVQADIHHPTDNTLLWDVVRVVTRLVGHLAAALGRRRIKGFGDRTRSARRRMQEIQRMTPKQRHEHQTGKYRELIGIAEEVVESARTALRQTRKAREKIRSPIWRSRRRARRSSTFVAWEPVSSINRAAVCSTASKFQRPRSSIRFSSPIPTSSSAARCRRRSSSGTRCSSPKAPAA
jgi:transposase, IS5 family